MAKEITNVGASVRAKLLNIARTRKQQYQLVLTRYVLERLLYRLSQTDHKARFVLKGAMLLTTWFDDPHRPTRDVDFLAFGDSDSEAILAVFREVCGIVVDDGVTFDVDSLRVEQIREELEYGGLRIKAAADVGGARVAVVVDIGFGDAVEPGLEEVQMPALLDQPAPQLRAYARETVIAEKFQAIVMLGRANSRLKDFYDIWVLHQSYDFSSDRLVQAVSATFARRNTPMPTDLPDGLTVEFARDPVKQQQWAAFIREVAVDPGSLENVIGDLAAFLMPIARTAQGSD